MSSPHWQIPRTHYDFLCDREPEILDSINKDMSHIESNELHGPFSSTDDCSIAFPDYLENKVNAVREDLRNTAEDTFGPLSDEEFEASFRQIPELPSLMYSSGSDYLACLNFTLFNKKLFYIAESLVAQLAVTELDAPSEYLRLPFPSCMFVLNSDIAVGAMYRIGSNTPPSTRAPVTVFLSEVPYEGYRKIIIVAYHSKGRRVFNLIKRELLIRPDWSIERALHTDWNNLYEENEAWIEPDLPSVGEIFGHCDDESIFYQDGLSFFRIIINAILYLASSNPDIVGALSSASEFERRIAVSRSRQKRKKAKCELAKVSTLDGSIVGGTVGHIFVDRKFTPSNSTAKGGGYNLKRFLVRGHWRNQACGKGRKERRLIFIAPYFKGPEMTDLVNRSYVVR